MYATVSVFHNLWLVCAIGITSGIVSYVVKVRYAKSGKPKPSITVNVLTTMALAILILGSDIWPGKGSIHAVLDLIAMALALTAVVIGST
jgi:hypothetical protein